jgi:hypothetical protein
MSLAIAASAFAAEPAKVGKGKSVSANDTVHCYNIHDCKGNSDCATAENACKGQNACKGHGFKASKAAACLNAGGTISDIK